MKSFLYFLLWFIPLIPLAQKPKNNTLPARSVQVAIPSNKDTQRLTYKDSVKLSKAEIQGKEVKIYFQQPSSGSDWWKYFSPLIGVIVGIGIKEYLDRRKETKRLQKVEADKTAQLQKIKDEWIAQLNILKQPLKSQIQAFSEYIVTVAKNDFTSTAVIRYEGLNGENFKNLSKGDLITVFEKEKPNYKEAVKSANRVNGCINIIKGHHDLFSEKFNDFRKNLSVKIAQLNQNLQKTVSTFRKLSVAIEREEEKTKQPQGNQYYDAAFKLYSEQIFPNIDDGKFNPYKLETDFYQPLFAILGHLRLDEITDDLADIVSESLNSIKAVKNEYYYIVENLKQLAELYQEDLTALDAVIKEFS